MPWLVSIRTSGQVMGAFASVATRRSVIFSSEGLELVLVLCGSASSTSSAQKDEAANAPAPFRKPRRPTPFDALFMTFTTLRVRSLSQHRLPLQVLPLIRFVLTLQCRIMRAGVDVARFVFPSLQHHLGPFVMDMDFLRILDNFFNELRWYEVDSLAISEHHIPRHYGRSSNTDGNVYAGQHAVSN